MQNRLNPMNIYKKNFAKQDMFDIKMNSLFAKQRKKDEQ